MAGKKGKHNINKSPFKDKFETKTWHKIEKDSKGKKKSGKKAGLGSDSKKSDKKHMKQAPVKKTAFEIPDEITSFCAKLVDKTDEGINLLEELIVKLLNLIIDFAAGVVVISDTILDFIFWYITKIAVIITRKLHQFRMFLNKNHQSVVKGFGILLITGTAVVALFASKVDYEYSYNGRTLGVVKEQRDVLEVLELVSEELSIEYGSNIIIDPETDIEFKKIFSYEKEADSTDDVLRRFTYMGDIQVTAYGIYKGDERIAIVDSERTANSVLQNVMEHYMTDDEAEYISVSFAEDVHIEPYETILANVGSEANALKKILAGEQEEKKYVVESGDTLIGIAAKLDTTVKEIKEMNPDIDESTILHIGQKIIVQQMVPMLTIRTEEISTFAEAIDYETITKESSSYYQGETVVARAGQKGKQKVTARLFRENGEIVEREDLEVEVITEPVDKIVYEGTKKVPPKKGTGTFIRPVNVSVYRGYGMRWGRMHYGLDYAASTGTAIHASDGGTVTAAGWSGAYGYRVVIDHGGGFKTLYGHCSKIYVSVGDKVYQGQTIAAVGNTGRSTGPHCHFEIFKNGKNVNPANYL